MLTRIKNLNSGQSLIEIILAVAIFIIISSSAVMVILGSFSTTRLAEEESKATLLATEGIEATQSIRNSGWINLVNGDHGLANSGVWNFSGSSDTDSSGKYNRKVTVSDVYRDINGEVVSSGGTIDTDTKKVVTTIAWNFSPTRQNSIVMESYLTNWQKGKSTGAIEGVTSCLGLCQSFGYSGGICRQSIPPCTRNGEIYQSVGDQYCLVNPYKDCCCIP